MTASRSAFRRGAAAATPEAGDVRAALDAFRRIVQELRAAGRDGERRAGLSSAQLFALQQIGGHPGASVNQLARLTFTHQSTVSVVIQRLVDQRLVARTTASDDRRRYRLMITSKGQRVLQRAPVAVQERLIAAIAALPPKDQRALSRLLGQVSRLVNPGSAAKHPPMLFEEPGP